MLPAPGVMKASPKAGPSSLGWADLDDDDGWQDEDDAKRYHYRPPARLDSADPSHPSSNATGAHLELESDTLLSDTWRQKQDQDESDYTRIRLEEDEDSEQVHMRTKYLFDEDKAMTPLSQMQATKELLTEGQRIAYVGLCHLVARRMVRDAGRGWEGTKVKQRLLAQVGKGKGKGAAEVEVVESAGIWMIKIMARLYQHMELEQAEQKMIESLAEHGVDPSDLVPALTATHTVKNPEFDPQAKKQADLGPAPHEADEVNNEPLPVYEPRRTDDSASPALATDVPLPPSKSTTPRPPTPPAKDTAKAVGVSGSRPEQKAERRINPFGDDDDDDDDDDQPHDVFTGLSTAHAARPTLGSFPSQTSSSGHINGSDIPGNQKSKSVNPFGDDEDEDGDALPTARGVLVQASLSTPGESSSKLAPLAATSRSPPPLRPSPLRLSSFDDLDDDEGDIGRTFSPTKASDAGSTSRSPMSARAALPQRSTSSGSTLQDQSEHHANGVGSGQKIDQTRGGVLGQSRDEADGETEAAIPPDGSIPREREDPDEATDSLSPDAPDKPGALPSLPGVSTTLTNLDETVTLDIRWTVLCDLFLVLIADSVYDARSRAFLQHIAESLGFDWLDVVRFENRITDALEIQEAVEKSNQGEVISGRIKQAKKKRYAMMGLAAVGGGLVIGLSAGLLAPVIGAGLGAAFATVGITGTTGFLAGAGGAAVITTGGVLTGANIAGQGMARRTREVRTFEFRPLHNNKRVSCYLTMAGFMASKFDDVRLPFSVLDPVIGDVISVLWEPEMMAETGSALKILTSEVLTQVGQQVLAATVMTALMSALQWPLILTKLGYLIDNPWSNALDRARAAGLVLADVLVQRHAGVRPISLIGFSLGARAIFYALVELARVKAYGIVQDVFLFGTTVTASRTTWLEARSVVAGRFVNGFATNDWMLGYLFRATSGGINTVAGLRPVETVPGLENVEVTDIITGHMSYRSMMPLLLKRVGFIVTADHFDEPEDPDVDMSVQERTIVNEAEEEAKRNRKKILGIFPRSAPKSKSGSGSSTPATATSGTPNPGAEQKLPPGFVGNAEEYDAGDDDDLPPREEGGVARTQVGMESKDSLAKAEAEAVKGISKTAGFDFRAISKELGKDINPDDIKLPTPTTAVIGTEVVKEVLARSGSAPPPSVMVQPPAENERPSSSGVSPLAGRSSSYDFANRERNQRRAAADEHEEDDEDNAGDIAASALKDMSLSDPAQASWGNPTASSILRSSTSSASPSASSTFASASGLPEPSPPLTSASPVIAPPSFGYNAWSQPSAPPANSFSSQPHAKSPSYSTSSLGAMPGRAAPPARPHPAELMANPFASAPGANGFSDDKKSNSSSTGGGSGMWGWGKKQKSFEEDATKNPW